MEPFCIFCGSTDRALLCRGNSILIKHVKTFLEKYVNPTGFHFESLLHLQPQPSQRICRHCGNWRRHTAKGRVRKTIVFTPLDHVIMHVLSPGVVQEPDHRCFGRLVATALKKTNPFRSVIPVPCLEILHKCVHYQGELLPEIVIHEWWKLNGEPRFFRNKNVGKMVRRAIRQRQIYENFSDQKRIRWRH